MKVTVEIECTPEEARQFMGLPDLQPMQAAVMAEMEKRVLAEMDRFSPEPLLRSWMSLVPQNSEQMQGAFLKLFQQSFTGSKSKSK
ncbi:DUF6489 family protein [Methylobacterium soli]|uniref:Uncharacterized protein n=1 Tax=Methylobacterium soli TaxID=553447 RepID=A0A6L3SVF4_9HYPH|nr:DUF6489 family protein [Methylobacterium soli]KAB1077242.1 hypothetical protein F6X53_19290 [Methylobacterium soli]GJE45391.1 hypothetical protein AEGHOMDF_4585 [Methylobacterium soli]